MRAKMAKKKAPEPEGDERVQMPVRLRKKDVEWIKGILDGQPRDVTYQSVSEEAILAAFKKLDK